MNHVEASLSFPNYPRFCGQIFLRGNDKELSKLCVEAYNDWQVDEWCAGSDGRLIPLCLVPLWDAELAAAEVRRNAARGVRAVAFSELPPWLGLPSIHSRLLGSVLPGVRGDRHRRGDAHRFRHQDDHHVRGRARCGAGHEHLHQQRGVARRLPVLRRARAPPRAASCSTPRRRSGGSRSCSSASTTCGRRTRAGATARTPSPSRRRVLLPPGHQLLLQGQRRPRPPRPRRSRTTSCSRPTTRTRTAPGPTRTRWPRRCSATSTTPTVLDIVRGNAIRLLGLEGLGDGTGPRS